MRSDFIAYFHLTKMALRNVMRSWRHSLATLLAIGCAFIAISLFDGYLHDITYRINDGFVTRNMMGHIIVEKRDAQHNLHDDAWAYTLNAKEQEFLEDFFKEDIAVQLRVRFLYLSGILSAGSNNPYFIGFGYDVAEGARMRGERWSFNAIAGLPLHLSQEEGIVIGGKMGESIDCEYPSRSLTVMGYEWQEKPLHCPSRRVILSVTTEHAQVNAMHYPIVGLVDGMLADADRHLLHIPLEKAQRLADTDKISMVTVLLKDVKEAGSFIERLKRASQDHGLEFDVTRSGEHSLSSFLTGALQMLSVFRNLFMIVLILIGIMSVINTMTKSVNERIREIGTLRSLGFFRKHVVYLFAIEGGFLSLLACTAGLFITAMLSLLINQFGFLYDAGLFITPVPLLIQYAPMTWLFSAIFFSLLAIGAAWLSSRKACCMVVADAMRHVE